MRLIITFILSLLAFRVTYTNPVIILAPTPTPTPFLIPRHQVDISVPFIVQAPYNQWKDDRYQDACEEATVLMAISWALGLPLDKDIANNKIAQISAWQKERFGEYRDTSAKDTFERLVNGYFEYRNAFYHADAKREEIIRYLYEGKLVIVPSNGQTLKNPYFTQPGPERHMVLLRGYDPATQEFITNDPGVGKGEKYRYPQDILYSSIRDYPTGYHIPITETQKNIIVISPAND